MAIATAIGAAVGIGGAVLGASAQKKAANKAADTSLAVADKNNTLAREIYGKNESALSPFMYRGNAAGDAINALLGLPTSADMPVAASTAVAAPATPPQSAAAGFWPGGSSNDIFAALRARQAGQTAPAPTVTAPRTAAPRTTTANILSRQQNAFDAFRDSTGYQFRVNEGMNALNTGYAGRGLLNSGAAQKAAMEYGQNIGSAEFGNYLGYLGNQQGLGLSGASALAGVGQNYVNTISANNNSAGTAAANAALMKGQANANMFGGIANSLGNVFGSSFGGGF